MMTLVTQTAQWIIPGFVLVVLIFALYKKVNVFESFVEGAAEAIPMAVKLVPYLVAMLVAIGLLKDSGAMELFSQFFLPVLDWFNVPAEILPLAVMRPISGTSSLAAATEILHSYGPDSFLGRLASTLQGSTETTLFVLTVYFGTVGIKRTRYALLVGLIGDFSGFVASVAVCTFMFGQ